MIIGECPYCHGLIVNAMGNYGWSKQNCEKCGRQYWLLHSRFNPITYPTEEFEKEFEVDEEKKQIRVKQP